MSTIITVIDNLINAKMATIQTPVLNRVMITITNIGSPVGMVLLSFVTLAILLHKKRMQDSILLAIAMLGGLGLELMLKANIGRARPENALVTYSNLSFPSGHSMMSLVFFTLLIYLFKDEIKEKTVRYVFIGTSAILALLIGFSRVYLNVHWASDVIGGYLIGGAWITLTIFVFERVNRHSQRKKNGE